MTAFNGWKTHSSRRAHRNATWYRNPVGHATTTREGGEVTLAPSTPPSPLASTCPGLGGPIQSVRAGYQSPHIRTEVSWQPLHTLHPDGGMYHNAL